ncbi:hypothetical protein TSACC_22838 [Terrimicrobium sacchariphilum]|uniref:Uncharacterized protein n=1 Tax=Terrimicrobium sacchariphilum TaxID=690879 RepID=A0A146GAZ8_TERSA|nr:hypothetical protein [Terrimicrobium sacchariphilum]GAT34413.1 hypothetical protein TSACC_22838 [Terrimicrobium sacchariphilum]
MPIDSLKIEESAKSLVSQLVLKELPLAVYDPNQPRRVRVPVTSFTIELLEIEEDEGRITVCAAGPVILQTPNGPWENHLRLYAPMEIAEGTCRLGNRDDVRTAYIVLTDFDLGTCKETAALANAESDSAG